MENILDKKYFIIRRAATIICAQPVRRKIVFSSRAFCFRIFHNMCEVSLSVQYTHTLIHEIE